MAKRSVDFWLGMAMALLLLCLAATAAAHEGYARAEAAYHAQLTRIAFTPHGNASGHLASMLAAAHRRLLVQTLLSGATALATVGVLLQVLRRRNERVLVEAEE